MSILPFLLLLGGLLLATFCCLLWKKERDGLGRPEFRDESPMELLRDPAYQRYYEMGLACIVFGGLGAICSIVGLIWSTMILYPKVLSMLAHPTCTPRGEDLTHLRIGVTVGAGTVLLWGLTRPHPSDELFESIGPVPIAPKGSPIVIPYARYATYVVIVTLSVCGVLINWAYTFAKGLYIAVPTEAIAVGYLAWGQVWRSSGKRAQYRCRHVFGPFDRLVYSPFCVPVAFLYGCAVVGFLLLTCLIK